MLLTLTSTAPQAPDLGFLLHKHPDRVQQVELPAARASIFYPEASPERCTVALLLDVDPVALVRGSRHGGGRPGRGGPEAAQLSTYVNDRPWAASSLLAVALGKAFKTALNGRCDARPDLVDEPLPLTVRLPALPARGRSEDASGMPLVRRLFAPLGWEVSGRSTPLGAQMADWGDAPYVDVELAGRHRLADALAHLYVLLPVLDEAKHYWVSADEVDKLLRRGQTWLPGHPDRELITRRYLGVRRRFVDDALDRLAALDDQVAPSEQVPGAGGASTGGVPTTDAAGPEEVPRGPLRQQRLDTVLAVLREVGARRVVDLGCGEGACLSALLADPAFTQILGVDVSARELVRAEGRLGLDDPGRLPDQQRARIRLRQSSAVYRDEELAGYDAMLLVEVVEHVDPERLPDLEASVFGASRPRNVVLTTPNAEHNVRYGIPQGQFRHPDHRFEWTRTELRAWAEGVAGRHGYHVELRPVGEDYPEVGPPTQLALFTREDLAQEDQA
ncbi:HEN1 C-terminal domain [Serinicoccus hydrothermalis]|uniref:Small RNA 2'-O-methyltransferase n=1 Tax=Serinicoccus hydrothermalis TaxID=1758689 RepID=A0A1B1NBK3_9MICO|nr:3' terminal RNA ribose 2'-O-methyltransferase Hen1 [Serinicoccus hydrothermalis]ANS78820.1 HEN1 C-terminal domain [Serinicoccus hydrothermalis]